MTKPLIQVLMVDDSEDDYLLTADILQYTRNATFNVTWASSFDAGLVALRENRFDALLIDFRMGDRDGFDFLAACAAQGDETPSIFLTGQQGREIEVAALQHGAEDFLPKKDLSPSLLERTILHAIERRLLLSNMRRSESRFRSLFEDSRIGMVLLDATGRVEEINEVAKSLLSPLPEGGGDVGDLFPSEAEKARKAYGELGKKSGLESLYLKLHRTTEGWAQVTFSRVANGGGADASGAPVMMIVRDITRDMAITRERDLLATFPEQNPHPVLRLTQHGICDYANRAASDLLREWGIGQGLPTAPPLALAAKEAYEAGVPREIERTVGGRIYTFTCAPITSFDRIYVYGRDVTEQRQAVKRLRRAALVFDNTDDGVMITDDRGVIRAVNASFSRITGFAESEALGKTPAILKSEQHDTPFYATLWNALNERGAWEGEIWNRRKEGEIYLQHSRIRAVYDDGGALTEFVSIFNDVTGARMRAEELERRAYNDPLTGLPNRLLFQDRLDMALARAARNNQTFAVMYLDLDGFKGVNDCAGHLVGDKTLQWVATRISAALRAEDTLARLGGDEFAIIAEAPADQEIIDLIANRIHAPFADGVMIDGKRYPVSVSIGVAFYPENGRQREALIHNADAAMYRAKERGKKTTCYASEMPIDEG